MGYEKTHSRLKHIPFVLPALVFVFCALLPGSVHAATLSKPQNNLGLVGYWSFNEGTSTIAHDFSGNAGSATISGTVGWVSGKHGAALNFDGTTYASGQNVSAYRPTQWSISGWVYARTGSATYKAILRSAGGDGYTAGYAILVDSNSIAIRFGDGSSPVGNLDSGVNAIGVWRHFVITSDGTTWKIYIDGVYQNSVNASSFSYGSAGGLVFGSSNGMTKFDGLMDDFRFYNRTLSGTEVAALYTAGSVQSTAANESGLVGHWTFDEGTSTIAHDFSGNGNTGTLSGTTKPAWVSGKFASALNFNGSTSYVSAGSNSITGTSAFSVSGWLQNSTSGSYGIAAMIGNCAAGQMAYIGYVTTAQSGTGNSIGGGVFGTNYGSGVSDQNWHHVVLTFSGGSGGTLRLYTDGVQKTSGTVTPSLTSTGTTLGKCNTGTPYYYSGSLDDVRVYNRALSAADVAALYGAGSARINDSRNSRLTNGLVGLWSFDGADFTDKVYDRSGQGNNGYLAGATSTAKAIGKLGQALSLDGASTRVRMASFSGAPSSAMTVCSWIKTSYTGGTQYILNINRSPSNLINEGIFEIVSGKLRFWDYNGSSYGFADNTPDSTTTVTDGAWHLVCFVKNSTAGTYYLDGVADGTKSASLSISYGTADLVIGENYRDGNSYFNGLLDEVRVYNRALSAAEVKQLYNVGK